MKKPWEKLNSKIIHQNPWFCLREDDVVCPNGSNGKYFFIDGIHGVAIIAEDKEKQIYLVGQTRYPVGNIYSWEVIGGSVEELDPLEAAKKELQEEAGLLANDWQEIGYFYPSIAYSREKVIVYLVRDLKETNTAHEATEDITIRKEKINSIIEMIKNNEIVDGFSISAFYKYLLYINY